MWFNSNQNAAKLGDEEQSRGMEISTYYLLPGEREQGDNSALCLICCVNLGEVMFSFIKKEKKDCLFSALPLPSARQPELGCTNEIHSVYTRQNCTQQGWNPAGCGSWPAPGSLGGKKN